MAGSVYADDSPETPNMRFGMIVLTDCSPIVMAHELGYQVFGSGVERNCGRSSRQALTGENQATHMPWHAVRLDHPADRP
jgi:nitrate/nitrite transport system substrate-binding protein